MLSSVGRGWGYLSQRRTGSGLASNRFRVASTGATLLPPKASQLNHNNTDSGNAATFPPLLFPFNIKLPVFPVSRNLGASDDAGSIKASLSRFLFSSEEASHIPSPARSVWFPVTPRRVSVKKAPSFPGAPYVGIIICPNIRGAPAALHFVFPLSGFVTASRAATRVF